MIWTKMRCRSEVPVVLRLGLYVTLLSVLAWGAPMECPKWWHFYGERQLCFLVSTSPPLSWEQARDTCRSYGGDLTTIPDSETNAFVKGLIKSSREEYWIGLHDTVKENVFQWLDEDGEANFTYWGPNGPNNGDSEDCVFISAKNDSQWNNAMCSAHLAFSCQRAAVPATKPTEECPKGWHFYEERKQCFLLDPTPPLSWEHARAMCRFYGGDLTTIPDSKTNAFVKGLITSSCENYWIGLHDTVTENVFQWLDEDGETNFTYWVPDEPNNLGDEDCVFISVKNESRWNDAMCTAELGYSCQRASKSNYEALTPQATEECPKGWHLYGKRQQCFLLDPKPPLSWEQARDMCRSYGGDLTTIPDSETNAFVKGLIKSSLGEYWIGLHNTVTKNVFQWLDEDAEANFTYWAPNEPNNFNDKDCVFISAQNESQWNDTMCSAQLGFSCQRAAKINFAATAPQPIYITATAFKPTKAPEEKEVLVTSTPAQVKFTTSQTTEKITQPKVVLTTRYVPRQLIYMITIKTGNSKHAGTDAWVSIFFYGPRGTTRRMILDDHRNNFQRGSTDYFTVRALDVGPLTHVQISHDNSEDGPGWYINTIAVKRYVHPDEANVYDSRGRTINKILYEEYLFAYYGWLATDEGDGRLYRKLSVRRKSVAFKY